jgi:hypothetical protein
MKVITCISGEGGGGARECQEAKSGPWGAGCPLRGVLVARVEVNLTAFGAAVQGPR